MEVEEVIRRLNGIYGNENMAYSLEETTKYWKIVYKSYTSSSVYAFIAKADSTTKVLGHVLEGDVLKASSWTTPAKHARGNLNFLTPYNFSDTFGRYSATYLR